MMTLTMVLYLYGLLQLLKGFLGAVFGGVAGKVYAGYDVQKGKKRDLKAYGKSFLAFALATFLMFVFG